MTPPPKVRRTISLPADLDERLKALGRRINVSEACAEALRREVRELEHKEDDSRGVLEAIERLRAERLALTREARRRGFCAGAQWTKERARLSEIREAVAILAKHRTDYERAKDKAKLAGRARPDEATGDETFSAYLFVMDHVSAESIKDQVRDLASTDEELKRQESLFAIGFAEGVHDLWERMRPEVEAD